MTTRKRNEFLDIIASDGEDNDDGYDSEAAEESKGRAFKRRKTQLRSDRIGSGSDGEESEESELDENDVQAGDLRSSEQRRGESKPHNVARREDDDESESDEGGNDEGSLGANEYGDRFLDVTVETQKAKGKTKSQKPLKKLKVKPTKKNKTGVIYFSSLPPYLKPFALKSLLETRGFGPITKVFLTPSVRPPSAPRRRSNKRKTYSDGWVEFESKKTAKICAETLNASIVGGRKGGWYHDDVWNMRYLKGFRWGDLMETIQRERSEREAKRRIEDTRARKEEKVFLQGYEKGKMLDGIQRKNEEKRKRKAQEIGDGDGGKEQTVHARRLFRQNEVKHGRDKMSADEGNLDEHTRRVLGKIF
ncbi:RNA-binding ATPase activator ESF2 [Aspergillus lucknowensis]|uniref:Pre-rRNA-processing protein ESF2 n=1 Tax=Aspergillus lucknowensis TaxID=176173 RepID=A0ABR4LM51_9EURO